MEPVAEGLTEALKGLLMQLLAEDGLNEEDAHLLIDFAFTPLLPPPGIEAPLSTVGPSSLLPPPPPPAPLPPPPPDFAGTVFASPPP
jgi:hypothetical protein